MSLHILKSHPFGNTDKTSLVCPEVPPVADAGEKIDGIQCDISKTGALEKAWLNDGSKREALGLKFTAQDSQGVGFDDM